MKDKDRMRLTLLLGLAAAPLLGWANRRWFEPAADAARWSPMASGPARFLVYYGTRDHAALSAYDVLVLDSDINPTIVRRIARSGTPLGYLSLGEVHMGRSWATEIERQGLLLAPNPLWGESRFIDLRDTRWRDRVTDELVPGILARGFTGLFLDTLDDAAHLESLDPARYTGMTAAAAELVHAIRARFTEIPIMVNRGYSLLTQILPDIDMVLGESVHTTYDVASQTYLPVASDAVRWQTSRLNEARRLKPSILLFSLDYWTPEDGRGIARIYAQAESNGLIPYVATFDLTQIVPRS